MRVHACVCVWTCVDVCVRACAHVRACACVCDCLYLYVKFSSCVIFTLWAMYRTLLMYKTVGVGIFQLGVVRVWKHRNIEGSFV